MPQSYNSITHREFPLPCSRGLILTGSGQISPFEIVQSSRAKSTWSTFKEDTSLPLDWSCDSGCLPVQHEEGMRMGCWLCHCNQRNSPTNNTISPPKTHWAWTQCDRPLCCNDERNCFVEFHQLRKSGVGGNAEKWDRVVAGGGRFGGPAGFTKPHLMQFTICLNRKFYLLQEKTLLKAEPLAI